MTETESRAELAAFHGEIKRIHDIDETMFAVTNVDNLSTTAMEKWNKLQKIIEGAYNPDFAISSVDELAEEMKGLGKVIKETESTTSLGDNDHEFAAWMRNKMAVLKINAVQLKSGLLPQPEYDEELRLMKERMGL